MKPLTVLVVEDDALIGMLIGELLAEMGHTVCAIEGTKSGAVEAAAKFLPDMMIVDANLGGDSGVAVVDAIGATLPVPHVFTSGNVAAVLSARPQAVVLQKPFTEPQLVAAMHRAIDAKGSA